MADKYMYDAFISYRHTDLDKFVAENLHKQMEAFRLPRRTAAKHSGRDRISRVFRDKDELPLTNNLEDPIIKAIHNSEFLIVICSPRLRESQWCKKEIETFISIHGREKVFAVLIEGEPEESFPEELLYVEETVEKPDGTVETVKKPMEPLAADVRGKNRREMLKAMRTEILRLLAPMFSLSFDDLRQRHRERRMKRILAATAFGALVCFLFGTVSTVMALRIHMQKEQLEAQRAEIRVQSAEIQLQNSRLLEIQALNLAEESARKLEEGDRIGAIETAYQALTEYKGIAMPYTPEAQLALTESLYAYDSGKNIKAMYQMETAGVIEYMLCSSDGKTLITCDESGYYTIWDVEAGIELDRIPRNNWTGNAAFLGNDRIVFADETIFIYSIPDKSVTDTLDGISFKEVYTDEKGRYLLVSALTGFSLYDGDTLEEVFVYRVEDSDTWMSDAAFCRGGDVVAFVEKNKEGMGKLYFYNIDSQSVSGSIGIGKYYYQDAAYKEDTVFVLLNYLDDANDLKTMIMACNPLTAKAKWQKEYENYFGSRIYMNYGEGADNFMLTTSNEAWIIRDEDGAECTSFSFGSGIAGSISINSKDKYILLTRNGDYHYLDAEYNNDYLMNYRFISHSENVMDFQKAAQGYVLLPFQDNKVTYYSFSRGDDLTENSDSLSIPETEGLSYSEAVEYAQEKNLPNVEMISYIFFNTDKSLIFAFYKNGTLDIYETSEMELKNSLTGFGEEFTGYFGMDASGNLYLKGINHGYMLSPDFKLIGVIENLAAVEEGGSRLYIQTGNDSQYAVPVYTLEELLAKAEAFVIR